MFRVLRKERSSNRFNPKADDVWYTNSVLGCNTIGKTYGFLGSIMENEEMKQVTGHGGHACHVTYSLLHGITAAAIMQQTGHASVTSMQPYARMSVDSDKFMQDVLAGHFRRKSE